jgi:hypothetical protein
MRKVAILVLSAIVLATPALAEICALDTAPAATLLLPYFELDLARLNLNRGPEVQISIRNADAAPIYARVVFWTDMSVPTHAFTIYLTGYDVHTFELSDLFANAPRAFAEAHRGLPSSLFDGQCGALAHGDQIVRGYVTVDALIAETDLVPSDPGYFGSNGPASDRNVLVGEYLSIDRKGKTLEAGLLVPIEASSSDSRVTSTGNYTFYGRYVGWNASDHREPLPAIWDVRYQSPSLGTNTTLKVWRDSGEATEPFACGSPEDTGWYPLGQTQVVFFDEQENAMEVAPEIPAETQSILLFRRDVRPPFDSGWIYFNFHAEGSAAQAYVDTSQQYKKKRFRGQFPAVPLESLCGTSASE